MSVAEHLTVPHSLDAERAVLGSILLHAERFEDAAEQLDSTHFFRAGHRIIFAACQALTLQHVEIEFVTLTDYLARKGELDDAGGRAYLAGLVDGVPRAVNIAHYARIVREHARRRAAIHAANMILEQAYSAEDDASDVIDRAEQALFELADDRETRGFKRLSDIMPGVLAQIETWNQTKDGISGIASGFLDLDFLLRGFQPGNLIIVGARPSIGKSAFAVNVAQHAAKAGRSVGMFSLEMSEMEIGLRTLTAEASLDGHRLQRGRVYGPEWGRLSDALEALHDVKFFLDDSPFLTVFDVRSRARRLKAQHGLDLLILDYTQLMVGHERKRENRTLELAGITRMLKAIAKELQVPLIALSQLSRQLEERTEKRPILSDLRESGSLEQDADVVLFLHRPEVYLKDPPEDVRGLAEIIVAKHRNGPTGTVELTYQKEHMRFINRTHDPVPGDRCLPVGDR